MILDVNMPKMTGIEVCRRIRERADGRLLPILMLTGRNDIVSISDAFAAGASDFAQKGMNPRLLVERVRFLLRDRAMQDNLWSSRSKLLLAQRIARVGHWELTLDGRTLDMSPMVGEILERDAQPMERYESFVAMLDPAEQVQARQAFIACATDNSRFSSEHRLRTAAGKDLYIHQEAELVQAAGSAHAHTVLVTLQDLTRLRRAEDAVRHAVLFRQRHGPAEPPPPRSSNCRSRSRTASPGSPCAWRPSACTASTASRRRTAPNSRTNSCPKRPGKSASTWPRPAPGGHHPAQAGQRR